MATLTIRIQGKPDVGADQARNDGEPLDVVTLEGDQPTTPPNITIVWWPQSGAATLAPANEDPTKLRFTIPAETYPGTYRFRHVNTAGEEVYRELAVLTPNRSLRIPPLGTKGAAAAGSEAPTTAMAVASDNNASYPGDARLSATSGANFTGFALDVEKLYLVVDELAGAVDAIEPPADTEELTTQIAAHEERLDDVEDEALALAGRVTTLENAPPGEGVPEGLLTQVADHETRLDAAEAAATALAGRVTTLEGQIAGSTRLLKQYASESVYGASAYSMGAMYFQQGDKLPAATTRTILGAAGGSATFELVDETTSDVVATATTSASLAAVAFAGGEVTFPTTGLYSLRLRGSTANTTALFRGIDWTVTR